MSKNPITILEETKQAIAQLNDMLIQTNNLVLQISASMRSLKKDPFSVKNPKEVNSILQTRNRQEEKLATVLRERQKIEKAIEATQAKKLLAEQGLTQELAKERFELQQLNRQAKEAAILSSKLSTEYQKQSVILNQLRAKYKQVALTQGQSSKAAKDLANKIKVLDARLKSVDANVGQFQRSVGNYGIAMNRATAAARNLAGAMGLIGGAFLVVRVFSDAFKRIRDFDKEMQNMSGILRTTRPEIKALESEIIAVAAASVKTSNEVASLATSLLVLGKTKEEVIQLLEPVNNLSIALGSTSDETGEFLVQTLNAFGKGAESASEFADTIAGIRTSTSLDFQKMRDSFQYITPIANILGQDLAWTGAMVGVLADNGLKAEQAGRLLGTSLQKLAKSGLTLDDALRKIREAQDKGVEGYDLLAMASNMFDKQAAKIGIILANNSEKLTTYKEKIDGASGALDDLVNEQLKSLDAQLKITTSVWEKFVLSLENGEGVISQALGGVLKIINQTLEGLTLLNQDDATNSANANAERYRDTFKQISQEIKNGGEEGKKFAVIMADQSRDNVERLEAEKKAIEETSSALEATQESFLGGVQKGAEKLLGMVLPFTSVGTTKKLAESKKRLDEINVSLAYEKAYLDASEQAITEVDNSQKDLNDTNQDAIDIGVRSIANLREKIKTERERIEQLDLNNEKENEAFIQGQKNIDLWQKEIDALTGKTKAQKEVLPVLEGSVDAYQKLISKLEDERDRLATNTETWKLYGVEIDKVKFALNELLGIQNQIDFSELEDWADAIESDELDAELDKLFNKYISDGMAGLVERTGKGIGDLYAEFNSLYEWDFQNFLKFSKKKIDQTDLEEEEKRKYKQAALERDIQLGQEAMNAIAELGTQFYQQKIQQIDDEIQKNNDYYATILDNELLSEEQRSAIEAERDRKNAELEKKKRQEQRKQAQFQKAQTALNIIINTSLGVISALAQVPKFDFGISASAVAATIAGIGATQLATVLATPIPKYAKGRKGGREELAFVGDGGVSEIIEKRNNEIQITPNVPTLTKLDRGDVVHSSAENYLKTLPDNELYNDIHRHIALANLASTFERLIVEEKKQNSSKEIVNAIKQNRAQVKLINNINMAEMAKFMKNYNDTL